MLSSLVHLVLGSFTTPTPASPYFYIFDRINQSVNWLDRKVMQFDGQQLATLCYRPPISSIFLETNAAVGLHHHHGDGIGD
jgi:hypothetical protein